MIELKTLVMVETMHGKYIGRVKLDEISRITIEDICMAIITKHQTKPIPEILLKPIEGEKILSGGDITPILIDGEIHDKYIKAISGIDIIRN